MAGKRGPRGEAQLEARRWEILGAAVECFGWTGYGGTTVSAIAERAGLSHGLIHHYFPSKADLFTACIETGLAHMVSVRERALESGHSPDEMLRRWAWSFSHSMTDAFLLSRLVMQTLGAPGSHPPPAALALDHYLNDEGRVIVPLLQGLGHECSAAHDRYFLAFAGMFGARATSQWQADATPIVRLIYRQACFTLTIASDPEPADLPVPSVPWPQDITRTPWTVNWRDL